LAEMNSKPLGGDSNKFHGEYIGKVESIEDPEKLLRVQVRVFSVFTDDVPKDDLPWAEYRLPVGSRFNDGFFIPADVDDLVWVKFPYDGDTRRPVIIGSAHYAPDGKPNFPHEAWAGDDMHEHKRTGKENVPAANAYHEDVVFTQHGTTIELRKDTSIAIIQRGTGTELYVHPDGTLVIHGEKHIYFSSVNDTEGKVGGNMVVDIAENTTITTTGNTTVNTTGNTAIKTDGDTNINTTGHTVMKSMGKIDLDGGSGPTQKPVHTMSPCPIFKVCHPGSQTIKVSP